MNTKIGHFCHWLCVAGRNGGPKYSLSEAKSELQNSFIAGHKEN